MNTNSNTIDWAGFSIQDEDLDFIYNLLFEKEKPMTAFQLAEAVISKRIEDFRNQASDSANIEDTLYRPKKSYREGDIVTFPKNGNIKGTVTEIRQGNNPDIAPFSVMKLEMEDGSEKEFACDLSSHMLNDYDYSGAGPETRDSKYVFKKYGRAIARKINHALSINPDLTIIGGFCFPKALLSNVNPGYLNLAEAVLEMEEGRAISAKEIMEQLEYPIDSSQELTEFSFNYALHQDERFAEVGPVGKVLWTLKELEPEDVRKIPQTLKFTETKIIPNDFDNEIFSGTNLFDELEEEQLVHPEESPENFEICINYPHWKAGTLPLIGAVHDIFPTALETDNVTFVFRDKKTGESFPGWVIISKNYVCGLKQWYRRNNVIPGSIFRVIGTEKNEVVEIELIPPRVSKDWVRTLNINEKNQYSFDTRQHKLSTKFDERLVIWVENNPQLDMLWEKNNRTELSVKKQLNLIFRELAKDSPQGIVHFFELYAAMNLLRRIPPRMLMTLLISDESITQIDTYNFLQTPEEEN